MDQAGISVEHVLGREHSTCKSPEVSTSLPRRRKRQGITGVAVGVGEQESPQLERSWKSNPTVGQTVESPMGHGGCFLRLWAEKALGRCTDMVQLTF